MAKKQKTRQSWNDLEAQTKLIGISVPLPLHKEFREAAAKQQLNASALLRKLIIQHLDSATND